MKQQSKRVGRSYRVAAFQRASRGLDESAVICTAAQ
jgi:hypothetical protein